MKNSRLLLLMTAVAALDWVITKVSLRQVDNRAVAQVKKLKGIK